MTTTIEMPDLAIKLNKSVGKTWAIVAKDYDGRKHVFYNAMPDDTPGMSWRKLKNYKRSFSEQFPELGVYIVPAVLVERIANEYDDGLAVAVHAPPYRVYPVEEDDDFDPELPETEEVVGYLEAIAIAHRWAEKYDCQYNVSGCMSDDIYSVEPGELE